MRDNQKRQITSHRATDFALNIISFPNEITPKYRHFIFSPALFLLRTPPKVDDVIYYVILRLKSQSNQRSRYYNRGTYLIKNRTKKATFFKFIMQFTQSRTHEEKRSAFVLFICKIFSFVQFMLAIFIYCLLFHIK